MDVGMIPFPVLFLLYMCRIPLMFWVESTEHKLNGAFSPPTWQQAECCLTLTVLQPELETWGPGRVTRTVALASRTGVEAGLSCGGWRCRLSSYFLAVSKFSCWEGFVGVALVGPRTGVQGTGPQRSAASSFLLEVSVPAFCSEHWHSKSF